MTAEIPELTVLDSPIFDDMVMEQIEAHWDDEPACDYDDCDSGATWRHIHLCCRFIETYCEAHHRDEHLQVSDMVENLGAECVVCDHPYAKGTPIEDVQREVPL